MSQQKNNQLQNIISTISQARIHNLKRFPYNDATTLFSEKLKIFLQEKFSYNISFDRDEKMTYIKAQYKGINIKINVWDGIILTIEDEKAADIIDDFIPIFNEIMESNPICSYNYCTQTPTSYPTIEWNMDSNRRLYELINELGIEVGCHIENLKDFYTSAIIEELNEDLLTEEGYYKIFGNKFYNLKFYMYKIKQVQRLKPEIDKNTLYNWMDNCEATNMLNKLLVK